MKRAFKRVSKVESVVAVRSKTTSKKEVLFKAKDKKSILRHVIHARVCLRFAASSSPAGGGDSSESESESEKEEIDKSVIRLEAVHWEDAGEDNINFDFPKEEDNDDDYKCII